MKSPREENHINDNIVDWPLPEGEPSWSRQEDLRIRAQQQSQITKMTLPEDEKSFRIVLGINYGTAAMHQHVASVNVLSHQA